MPITHLITLAAQHCVFRGDCIKCHQRCYRHDKVFQHSTPEALQSADMRGVRVTDVVETQYACDRAETLPHLYIDYLQCKSKPPG